MNVADRLLTNARMAALRYAHAGDTLSELSAAADLVLAFGDLDTVLREGGPLPLDWFHPTDEDGDLGLTSPVGPTENQDRPVVCMRCGERWSTISESIGHKHFQ